MNYAQKIEQLERQGFSRREAVAAVNRAEAIGAKLSASMNKQPTTAAAATVRPTAWTESEDAAIVADYLALLAAVGRGEKINKAATRRALMEKLNNRSEGSIEFKRCNVSAVLVSLGRGYLSGYLPRSNYQARLVETVKRALGIT